MNIVLNGKKQEITDGITVGGLLKEKNLRYEMVTVEVNENVIAKNEYDRTVLKENDGVELVYYMGGG